MYACAVRETKRGRGLLGILLPVSNKFYQKKNSQVKIDKLEYYTKVYEGNIEGNIARSTPTDTPDKNTQKSPAKFVKIVTISS